MRTAVATVTPQTKVESLLALNQPDLAFRAAWRDLEAKTATAAHQLYGRIYGETCFVAETGGKRTARVFNVSPRTGGPSLQICFPFGGENEKIIFAD